MEFYLFLPQMRMGFDRLVASAQAAEAAGFAGITGMDHLTPPGADAQPMFDAMITNAWIAAHTSKLRVGSLVLCEALRHPAVLAKEAVSIDHASNGRFDLGIGWGSYPSDFENFGVSPAEPRDRVIQLRETLEVMRALWAGETVDFDGRFHHLSQAFQMPVPVTSIPIVIGGVGPKTLALVRDFADWWNLDIRHLDKFEDDRFARLHEQTGGARVSVQEMAAFVPDEARSEAVRSAAIARFGYSKPVIGTGTELAEHFHRRARQGIERTYVWFTDFANPETLAAFGTEVIATF